MTTTDEAAIAAIPHRFAEAWAAHDAAAVARLFTANGTLVVSGVHLTGAAAIRAHLTRAFVNELEGTRVTGERAALRCTGSLALLVTGAAGRAFWAAAKAAGEWRLAACLIGPHGTLVREDHSR